MDNGYLELVDAIKTLNQQTLKKWDQTTLCEIVQKNNDGTYNIRMLSDEGQNGTVIQNVKNGSKYKYKEGDQGILFKYKNQITMSFLVFKIGATDEDIEAAGISVSGGNTIIPSVNPCGSNSIPIWIDSNGQAQVVVPAEMSVGFATSAGTAGSATSALSATTAGTANAANYANNAQILIYANGTKVNAGNNTNPVYIQNGVPVAATNISANNANRANNANNANTANTANALNYPNTGDGSTPVYFVNGVPVACTNITSNSANTAQALVYANGVKINSGGNTGPVYFENGVPKTVNTMAMSVGSASTALSAGTATTALTATTASTANKANAFNTTANIGNASTPVYIHSNGVPVACTNIIASNAQHAANADWADGASYACAADTATFANSATTATTANTANKANYLNSSAGNSSTPVYINAMGAPVACTNVNANIANKANALNVANTGTNTTPVYFENGVPKIVNTMAMSVGSASTATSAGTAASANHLTMSAGNASTPVYINAGGYPVACTNIVASNAQHANEANTANALNISNTGNTTTPVYFVNGIPQTVTPSLMSVGYAASAGTAGSATSAIYATSAGSATTANSANTANYANYSNNAYRLVDSANVKINTGSTTTPVYFDNGVPKTVNTAAMSVGSASTALSAGTATTAGTANYANSAGSATTATNAAYANTAGGASHFLQSAGSSNTPVYINATGYPVACTNVVANNAAYAANAGYADNANHAISANSATTATTATNAAYANSAGQATNATYANEASKATNAVYANSAGTATSATHLVGSAGNSSTPVYINAGGYPVACTNIVANNASWAANANFANTANYATSAGSATTATNATYANNAKYADNAGYADTAAKATNATYANSAGTATSASTATNATYANSAGTATSASTAANATYANNAGYATSANGANHLLSSAGSSNTPVYINATGYPVACTNVNANYAISAGSATTAANATYANNAKYADNSGYATTAATATNATYANSAGSATTATNATYANSAGSAGSATTAANATYANNAGFATSANGAYHLMSGAGSANTPVYINAVGYPVACTNIVANTATYATSAGSATTATNAAYATNANYAAYSGNATKATNATYANSAGTATNATYAVSAGSATTATNAIFAANSNYAISAGTAAMAANASYATMANYANYAGSADVAATACVATNAIYAANAGYATNAGKAEEADKVLLASKTYTGVYSASTATNEVYRYFGEVKPINWDSVWSIKYRLTIQIANQTSGYGTYECYVSGTAASRVAYANFNNIKSTSYYPIYYTTLTTETNASYTAGNGHLIGIYLGSSYSPTSSTYARTINVELLETINCTFDFFDTIRRESDMPSNWAVSSRNNADAVTQGLQETGDNNTTTLLRDYYTTLTVGSIAIVNNSIVGIGADGKVVPIISNTTTKPPFKYKEWIFRIGTYSAGANLYNVDKLLEASYVVVSSTAPGANIAWTAGAPIYLKGHITGELFEIDTTTNGGIVFELPNSADGYQYFFLGYSCIARTASQDKYITYTSDHPVYEYVNGSLIPYQSVEDETPYSFRQSPDNIGNSMEDKIIGGSLPWNQLIQFVTNTTTQGITATIDANGVATLSGSLTTSYTNITQSYTPIVGHKYFVASQYIANPSNFTTLYWGMFNSTTNKSMRTYAKIGMADIFHVTATTGSGTGLSGVSTGTNLSGTKIQIICIDLTLLLGSDIADRVYALETATAGKGVAWLKNFIIKKPYYNYNAGTLYSVNTSAHKMVGFNQWDEQNEIKSISSKSCLASKNIIKVNPDTIYSITCDRYSITSYGFFLECYLDGTLVSTSRKYTTTFTIPSDCNGIKFGVLTDYYGSTYQNDICINISDPSKNGTYEPYESYSYQLDESLNLYGILKPELKYGNWTGNVYFDGDEYPSSGNGTRNYGSVDLGTLTYQRISYLGKYIFMSNENVGADTDWQHRGGVCATYVYDASSVFSTNDKDKIIALSGAGIVYIVDNSYTDKDTFKTAMSGKYLVYELATPTSFTADPYTNPQTATPGGTEQYIDYAYTQNTRDVEIPVGHQTTYPVAGEIMEYSGYAHSAEYAVNAGSADYATSAGSATTADSATNATNASYALSAGSATLATTANALSTSAELALSNLPPEVQGLLFYGGTLAGGAVPTATLTDAAKVKLGTTSATVQIPPNSQATYKGIYFIATNTYASFYDSVSFTAGDFIFSDGVKWHNLGKVNNCGYYTELHIGSSTPEVISNKVTSISSASTDTQYPSAKCVYDIVGDIETLLAAL